jgi:acylphosphatase
MKQMRVRVIISGNVQGVFFRSFIKSNARMFNISGWVKNVSNGKVEAVFRGEEYEVNKIIELCKQGPPGSDVKNVEVKEDRSKEQTEGFDIR